MEKNLDLPHDYLAEKAVIGSLIIDNGAFDEITELQLSPKDFYNPQYSLIFDAINNLAVSDKPFDLVSVCAKLADMAKLETIGGQPL